MLPIIRIIGVGKKMGFLGFARRVIYAISSTVISFSAVPISTISPFLRFM
jgi:hypothetical protein